MSGATFALRLDLDRINRAVIERYSRGTPDPDDYRWGSMHLARELRGLLDQRPRASNSSSRWATCSQTSRSFLVSAASPRHLFASSLRVSMPPNAGMPPGMTLWGAGARHERTWPPGRSANW